MKAINNKKELLQYLDQLILYDEYYKMPKFSDAIKQSDFFQKNHKKIIEFINKVENYENTRKCDELIFCSYFSSKLVIKKIKQKNQLQFDRINRLYKKINFKKNQKKIYL